MAPTADPQDTYELSFDRDRDRAEDRRRRFVFKHLTARQWKRAAEILDHLDQAAGGAAMIDEIIAGLSLGLIGWHHVRDEQGEILPFAHKDIDRAGTNVELVDLFVRMVRSNGLTADQLKKSASPLASEQDGSARTADNNGEHAQTSPTIASPSWGHALPVTA